MKCILHIGTEKTGSTTLQEFLNLNRSILAEYGYLYTKSAGLRNNIGLAIAALNVDRRDEFTQVYEIFDDKDLISYRNNVVNKLRAELNDMGEGIHTVIFSSEHFQSRLTTDSELSQLRDILNELGFDQISVVVYLRPPAEIANSLWTTAVKTGATNPSPPRPDNDEHWRNICDHRNTLMRFRNIFGLQAVSPRIFSKADLVSGSVIDDFADAIKLPLLKDEYVIPDLKNESMTITGIELLRRINQEIPMFGDDQRQNPLRRNIASFISKHLEDGDRYRMPLELHQQYEDAFRESNEWVRAEYFPNRDVLFEPTNHPCARVSGIQENELDQIAKMISAMWLDSQSHYNSSAYKVANKLRRFNSRITRISKGITRRCKQA